ncbi:hypothetical protein AB0O47_38795 [Streptomyces noursei]
MARGRGGNIANLRKGRKKKRGRRRGGARGMATMGGSFSYSPRGR